VRHDNDYYNIVVGISHSWVIDALLFDMFPALQHHHRKVIKTATFCKAECDHLEYRRAWKHL
jgi:hypothetical protein